MAINLTQVLLAAAIMAKNHTGKMPIILGYPIYRQAGQVVSIIEYGSQHGICFIQRQDGERAWGPVRDVTLDEECGQ